MNIFFCTLAYPVVCFVFSCVVRFFFCDDHLFGENRWSCICRGTSSRL